MVLKVRRDRPAPRAPSLHDHHAARTITQLVGSPSSQDRSHEVVTMVSGLYFVGGASIGAKGGFVINDC